MAHRPKPKKVSLAELEHKRKEREAQFQSQALHILDIAADSLSFSNGGEHLYTASGTTVRIINSKSAELLHTIEDVNAWSVGLGEQFIIYGTSLKVLDSRSLRELCSIDIIPQRSFFRKRLFVPSKIAMSPDGKRIAATGRLSPTKKSEVRIWSVSGATLDHSHQFPAEGDPEIAGLQFISSDLLIWGRNIYKYRPNCDELLVLRQSRFDELRQIAGSDCYFGVKRGNPAYGGRADKAFEHFEQALFGSPGKGPNCYSLSQDGTRAVGSAIVEGGNETRIVDTQTGDIIRRIPTFHYYTGECAFSPDNQILAAICNEGFQQKVVVFDVG